MHSALDPRDLVPDEAEQLAHSGYVTGDLTTRARAAAAASDLDALARIREELAGAPMRADWSFDEPSDPVTLGLLGSDVAARAVDPDELPGRLRGAWLGRTVGNTLGKPIEGLSRGEVEAYLRAAGQWPQTGYVALLEPLPNGVSHLHESAPVASAGLFTDVPRDDDIDWTILGLHLIERYGRDLTTDDIATEWLDRIPFTQTFTAERAAYRNLIHGLHAPQTAVVDNPYREWIGALIRADIFGYVQPGDPAAAVRLALIDARLTHVKNGIYGEMWAAALVATAFSTDSAEEALAVARRFVPDGSRLAATLDGIRELHRSGANEVDALDWIDRELGHYNWVHTLHNAAAIAAGLLWGKGFTDSVALTIAAGRDTDSSAATTGSVYGALHGDEAIPAELVGTTHHHVRSSIRDFDRVTIDELAARTLAVAHVALPTACKAVL
ncbi:MULTISPECIES: ADP-ribosylglycohydrolase family protein [Microbacterium]|uniref:ADP-ribosylglycohydrolase family protein n=1 Tax=Microbacterium mcarthurae TaxID=3035918 RepID=A0ABW9GFF5_9MICO|nr:ADP-ribosylglycohydrolase family protein [Microbacterium sp. ACRRU]MCG7417518.1 ADP-ribosylglycohydrolase family protein [Microbacterium sp. ACRRU]